MAGRARGPPALPRGSRPEPPRVHARLASPRGPGARPARQPPLGPGRGVLRAAPRAAGLAPGSGCHAHLDSFHAGLQLELLHQALQGAHAGPGGHGDDGCARRAGLGGTAAELGVAPGRGNRRARPAVLALGSPQPQSKSKWRRDGHGGVSLKTQVQGSPASWGRKSQPGFFETDRIKLHQPFHSQR